ncbi:sensor histidine kinase [Haloarcula marina]|uniref:sensor histidine kinase n=1 Tax=Haloarcula marina TaxID=2961574 RepID=UPI0020B6DB64|nr:histidine kinase N-terminal 7TM domain-containing protein [Halomicroarcula marina]
MSVTVVVLVGIVMTLSGLAAVGWRNRTTPGGLLFAVLQAISAVWILTTAVGLLLDAGPVRLRVWGVATGLSLLAGVGWLAFVLDYAGRKWWLRPLPFGLVAAPLVAGSLAYVFSPTWPPLIEEVTQTTISAGTVVQATIGPVGGALGVYLYGVFVGGFAVILKMVRDGNEFFLGQSIALVVGSFVSVAAGALQVLGVVPVAGYPLIELAVGGQSVILAYAVFRREFLRLVPAVARIGERTVFDELDEGILVVSEDEVVLRANPKALSYFGADELVGQSVCPVLERIGVSDLDELPQRFQRDGRTFLATTSTMSGRRSGTIGYALVVRDVTRLDRRQQRLQVLNRVLRHNVRNSMTVMFGAAGEIQAQADGDVAALADTVATQAERLTTTSEKAMEVERVFKGAGYTERVAFPPLVDELVSTFAERYPDTTITASVDVESGQTNGELLSMVLSEVVENAVVHTGPTPTVHVEVVAVADEVRITVTDDGPGIPECEITPIRDGEETALKHTSGLGLWLVYWGVTSLGGEVNIEGTTDGSTVELTVPTARTDSV